jgi:PAS domain S-box-containing protein
VTPPEHERVLERLARSEAALREAQAIAQLGSWTLDLATGELAWSDEIFRILGMRPGSVEPTLDFFFSLVHPQDLAAVRQELEAAYLRPDGRYSIAHRVLARDGVERYIRERGCVRFDADGCPLGISGTALDITERMRAEGDLLQRERLERGLLDLSALFLKPSGLGMDGLINQALARMGELTATDRAYLFSSDSERRAFSNTHEWTAPGIAPVIHLLSDLSWDAAPESARLLNAGLPVVIPSVAELPPDHPERALLAPQGIRSLLLVPVMQGEALTGFVGFDAVNSEREWSSAEVHFLQVFASLMVSAIERDRAYADMMVAKQREMIGHLASGVAHDFNNLLGVIDANVHYLHETLTRPGIDPEIMQVLEETHSALGQAKVVTSGMLWLSRAGGIAAERVDVEAAVTELVRILRQVLPPEIRLRLALEPGLAARSNHAFLQAALLNLVLNARDAMPGGGELTLSAAAARQEGAGAVTLGVVGSGDLVQLRVADTGCGMADETMGRLFEPLFSTKAQQRGHGLGLFMVHEFVLRSGARLEVDSRLGEGSEFRLLLPRWNEPRVCRETPEPAVEPLVPASLRVLVVDDDPRSRDSVRRLLEMDGAMVDTAENGLSCLERLRLNPDCELVLSDVSMPVLDGVALCGILRELYPSLPVILMTGQAPVVFPGTHLPGNPAVLRKPLDLQDLRAAIGRLNLVR